jgi:hypothetical protein
LSIDDAPAMQLAEAVRFGRSASAHRFFGGGAHRYALGSRRIRECQEKIYSASTSSVGPSSVTSGNTSSSRPSMMFARDGQKRITAATAIGINALRPIMHFQISMLRMWADSMERFAGKYEKGLEESAATVEEHSDKERAA